MKACLFTLAILVQKDRHLLPLTLDSLGGQEQGAFEVVLLDGEGSGRLSDLAERYPDLPIRVRDGAGRRLGELMNLGLEAARAPYVQFLEPGDRYISPHGLSYLSELIHESGEPHLVYSGFLLRHPHEAPRAVSFSLNLDLLHKGTSFRSAWFSRKAVQEMGGFVPHLSHRPAFDFFCKLFARSDLRAVYSRRVITDSEPHRTRAADVIGYANETCRILYRHFGLWRALRWIFVQDHVKMFRWAMVELREAFWRKER